MSGGSEANATLSRSAVGHQNLIGRSIWRSVSASGNTGPVRQRMFDPVCLAENQRQRELTLARSIPMTIEGT